MVYVSVLLNVLGLIKYVRCCQGILVYGALRHEALKGSRPGKHRTLVCHNTICQPQLTMAGQEADISVDQFDYVRFTWSDIHGHPRGKTIPRNSVASMWKHGMHTFTGELYPAHIGLCVDYINSKGRCII